MARIPAMRLNEFGLTPDYINEFTDLHQTLEYASEHAAGLLSDKEYGDYFPRYNFESIAPLRTYTQRYAPQEFSNAVTQENKFRVAHLESAVNNINELLDAGETDYRSFSRLHNYAFLVLLGKERALQHWIKSPVPQLTPWHISSDYNNELQLCYNFCSTRKQMQEGLIPKEHQETLEHLMGFEAMKPLRRYEQRYSEEFYLDVVNEKNKDAIASLNALVDNINQLMADEEQDYKKYFSSLNKLHILINCKRLELC